MPEVWLECIECGKKYDANEARYLCDCGDLLDVKIDLDEVEVSKKLFDDRIRSSYPFNSGVWRYKELINLLVSEEQVVSRGEGNTNLYSHRKLDEYAGVKIIAKHEGENPTGSFKDRGITVGITEAKRRSAKIVTCASTGNTSASLASYAAIAGIKCIVLIPEGKIAFGKLSQALAYGAKVFQIKGDFDKALALVQQASSNLGMYLLNSVNPWRIEGQKSIIFELLQQMNWNPPNWVAVPAGNLGNTSAFGKALNEMKKTGLIDEIPRIAAIQSKGANPFYKLFSTGKILPVQADTIATAINIGNPVNWKKAIRAIKETHGVVEQVSDKEIMDAKAIVDSCGIGCEPASAASVAGVKKLVESGVIKSDEKVACILTGSLLKDPDATINYHLGKLEHISGDYVNRPQVIEPTIEALTSVIYSRSK